MFGPSEGALVNWAGTIMARTNAAFARSVISLRDVQPRQVLEVGFGPGVGIQLLAKSARAGRVAGVDCSKEMVEQATARNAEMSPSHTRRRGRIYRYYVTARRSRTATTPAR
jgi:trans-aconitate methyltransferase